MRVQLNVKSSDDYFSIVEREIDWDEDNDSKISITQATHIDKIIALEVGIFLMRRGTGFSGMLIDEMISIRREMIKAYEKMYEPYIEYNDFY